ncbi:hypothetical protein FGB62_54g07 [Gracilaria domingensis]|nr:hypothetical protein FGB62_54g07 [Gracilaria domingensis]
MQSPHARDDVVIDIASNVWSASMKRRCNSEAGQRAAVLALWSAPSRPLLSHPPSPAFFTRAPGLPISSLCAPITAMENCTVQEAPVIRPTIDEMDQFAEFTARASDIDTRYGAVLIDPPADWSSPPLRMYPSFRFFIRTQVLPESSFVDPHFIRSVPEADWQQSKRRKKRSPRAPLTEQVENNAPPKPLVRQNACVKHHTQARKRSHKHPPSRALMLMMMIMIAYNCTRQLARSVQEHRESETLLSLTP